MGIVNLLEIFTNIAFTIALGMGFYLFLLDHKILPPRLQFPLMAKQFRRIGLVTWTKLNDTGQALEDRIGKSLTFLIFAPPLLTVFAYAYYVIGMIPFWIGSFFFRLLGLR